MATVVDRWHLSRPPSGAKPCSEHQAAGKVLVPAAEHGRGKRWQVRYRDAAGEQCKENFAKRSQADSRAARVQADLDAGTFLPRQVQRQDFRSYAEEWRKQATYRQRTESNVERALRLHVYPILGKKSVATITHSDVRKWMKDRSEVLAPSSMTTPWNALNGVMAAAIADGLRGTNPCHGLKLAEPHKDEVVPLEPDVVKALIATVSDRYRALVRLAAVTGLRGGELFGLEVDRVDLAAGLVEVDKQLVGPDKGVPYLGEPKTGKSYRTVPLSASDVAMLRAYLEQFPPAEVDIEDRTDKLKPHWRKARLLFLSEHRAPLRRGSWAKVWARNVKRADKQLADDESKLRVPGGVSLHDLRHFYASVLIKHGATVKKVQRRLGHQKPSITLDLYVHLWDEDDSDDTALMTEILGP
ncbi:tyrosine-type recombinase/integrase [Streptomyces smyrnaeus]|uniref:tyrosine-type recombinase/integrase n=1 Tax=Streptomyces smyrnaeus TaxID=1387713 RepID=UPI003406E9C9